jgi:hypothetical protein
MTTSTSSRSDSFLWEEDGDYNLRLLQWWWREKLRRERVDPEDPRPLTRREQRAIRFFAVPEKGRRFVEDSFVVTPVGWWSL